MQILLNPHDVAILKQIAQEKNTSVGDLVRKALEKNYISKALRLQAQRQEAVNAILALQKNRNKNKKLSHENSLDIIHRMREERTQHLLDLLDQKK